MLDVSIPNLFASCVIALITIIYSYTNWDCFESSYRIRFALWSAIEIVIIATSPPALIIVGALSAASKSQIARGDESYIKDFPTVFHFMPGSFVWHCYNTLMALVFTGIVNLVYQYYAAHS
jgi:hypothetical protein